MLNEDDSVKHEGKWTRADLPSSSEVRETMPADLRPDTIPSDFGAALDKLVDHLNEYHPRPDSPAEWLERELDNPDEQRQKMIAMDEARIEANIQRNRAIRERDAAVERAERAEGKLRRLRDAHSDLIARHRRLSDEMEQSAPAVSRADVERVVHRYIDGGFDELHVSRVKSATDAFMALLSGSDPAVYVVRESDIEDCQRNEDGDWEFRHGGRVFHDSRDPRDRAASLVHHREQIAQRVAVIRAIEAEQAEDPVEEQARSEADRRYSGEPNHAFIEGALWANRHVLGQEADQ